MGIKEELDRREREKQTVAQIEQAKKSEIREIVSKRLDELEVFLKSQGLDLVNLKLERTHRDIRLIERRFTIVFLSDDHQYAGFQTDPKPDALGQTPLRGKSLLKSNDDIVKYIADIIEQAGSNS